MERTETKERTDMDDTKTLSEAGGSLFAELIGDGSAPPVDWDAVKRDAVQRHNAEVAKSRISAFRSRFALYQGFDLESEKLAQYRQQLGHALSWTMDSKGLLLAGTHGGGKTYALFLIAQRLIESGEDLAWWNAQDLAGRICEEIEYGADHARGFVDALAARKALVIDDLGQEHVSGSQRDRVESWILTLIDKRCQKQHPTLVSTNLGAKQYHAKYGYDRGAAIVRRLVESSEVVRF